MLGGCNESLPVRQVKPEELVLALDERLGRQGDDPLSGLRVATPYVERPGDLVDPPLAPSDRIVEHRVARQATLPTGNEDLVGLAGEERLLLLSRAKELQAVQSPVHQLRGGLQPRLLRRTVQQLPGCRHIRVPC